MSLLYLDGNPVTVCCSTTPVVISYIYRVSHEVIEIKCMCFSTFDNLFGNIRFCLYRYRDMYERGIFGVIVLNLIWHRLYSKIPTLIWNHSTIQNDTMHSFTHKNAPLILFPIFDNCRNKLKHSFQNFLQIICAHIIFIFYFVFGLI